MNEKSLKIAEKSVDKTLKPKEQQSERMDELATAKPKPERKSPEKPPKVSQADFNRRQRERNKKQREIREARAIKIRAEQLKEVRPPVRMVP